MNRQSPVIRDIWPFTEIVPTPELSLTRVDDLLDPVGGALVSSSIVRREMSSPTLAPQAAYAIRLHRSDGLVRISRWSTEHQDWDEVSSWSTSKAKPPQCVVLELSGVLLGNVTTIDRLRERMSELLAKDFSRMSYCLFASMAASFLSIALFFFGIRAGAEAQNMAVFILLIGMAACAGVIRAFLGSQSRILSEHAQSRMRKQFLFESQDSKVDLKLSQLTEIVTTLELQRQDTALSVGLLLLLILAYFIAPLVILGVMIAVVLTSVLMSRAASLESLHKAQDRAAERLKYAMLSLYAVFDPFTPKKLLLAKRQVLSDRAYRYAMVTRKSDSAVVRATIYRSLAQALAFLLIFGAYGISTYMNPTKRTLIDPLINGSLLSVAPFIVLFSISQSTIAAGRMIHRWVSKTSLI